MKNLSYLLLIFGVFFTLLFPQDKTMMIPKNIEYHNGLKEKVELYRDSLTNIFVTDIKDLKQKEKQLKILKKETEELEEKLAKKGIVTEIIRYKILRDTVTIRDTVKIVDTVKTIQKRKKILGIL